VAKSVRTTGFAAHYSIGVHAMPIRLLNSSVAPTCPTSRSQVPISRPAPPIAIARPIDLPSAIQAINQLIMIYNNPVRNNTVYPYIPDWIEVDRNTTVVRVTNPNDPEMWVDVERITNLTFQDRSTDRLFQWEY
jgi:hypothetical protein